MPAQQRLIEVLDLGGRVRWRARLGAGDQTADVDVSRFPSSLYFVRLHAGGAIRETPVAIVR